jgi:quercetin dioxygenase-like cupin family protein
VLKTHAMTSVPGREGIMVAAELAVGGAAPRHTHPGEEFVYVLEGTATFDMAGQPLLTIKPGDAFVIPPNTPHVARNTGAVPLKLLSTYVIPAGQPLATPAPLGASASPR